jgi:hypothetical protein
MGAVDQPIDSFEGLRCRGAEGWVPLPAWARFMLDAGAAVASFRADEGKLVIAVSVPTRAFAAALAGTSAVVTSFREDPAIGATADHFQRLASLPVGTPVTHRARNMIEQGTLLGVRHDVDPQDSRLRLKVQLAKEIRYLPEEACHRIQVISDPGTLSTRKRKLVRRPDFVSRALAGVDVGALSATTRLDCVIIGVRSALEYELVTESFASGAAPPYYEGNLQGILRARQFGGANDPYRSAVISASAEADDARSAGHPAAVVFDGSAAFNNWRSSWRESNWLVILDRSSPSAEDGAAAIGQAYARRLDESDVLAGTSMPAGIEMVAYLERQ